jgi:phage gpG-like protein
MSLRGVTTFDQFAAAARRGELTPSLAVTPGGGRAGGGVDLPPQLANVIRQLMVSDVKSHIASGTSPDGAAFRPLKGVRVSGGSVPLRDTGVLMASIHGTVEGNAVVVQTTHPAAPVHNFGATIRPTKAKKLAIPLTREAKRAGSPRRFPRKLAVRPTRKAGTLLMFEAGKVGTGQFLLVDSVTIPARPFMGLSAGCLSNISRAVAEAVARGWYG